MIVALAIIIEITRIHIRNTKINIKCTRDSDPKHNLDRMRDRDRTRVSTGDIGRKSYSY